MAEAKRLKNTQLKTWTKSDYRQIYANWYDPKWCEGTRLDTTAKFIKDFIEKPFAVELGSNCPHIGSVNKILDWYDELQTEQDYVVDGITIDKLEGLPSDTFSDRDLKITMTFGDKYNVEVEVKDIEKSSHRFSCNQQKFRWKPGDSISCKVYEVDLKWHQKCVKVDSEEGEKYTLLKVIDQGMVTQKWEDASGIEGRYPVIKLSVLRDGKKFVRPNIEKP